MWNKKAKLQVFNSENEMERFAFITFWTPVIPVWLLCHFSNSPSMPFAQYFQETGLWVEILHKLHAPTPMRNALNISLFVYLLHNLCLRTIHPGHPVGRSSHSCTVYKTLAFTSSFPSWNLLYERSALWKHCVVVVEFPWCTQLHGCCYPYSTLYISRTPSPADCSN